MDKEISAQEQHKQPKDGTERLRPYQYKKGQTGNPSGRPKGISLKEYARNQMLYMTDAEKEEFMHGLNKIDVWKQAEGNPDTKTDITTKGDKIEFTPAVAKVVDEFESKLKEQL